MRNAAPVEILRLLAAHRVDFVVVGMAAGVLRGAPVTTVDLGIVHRRGDVAVLPVLRATLAETLRRS